MAQTTYTGLSQRTTAWAVPEALDHARPIEVLAQYGMGKPIPKNKAQDVKFRRPVPLAIAEDLTEGVPPAAKALTYEDRPAKLKQFGDVIQITDVVQDLAEDPVLKDSLEILGEQMAETKEAKLWGVLQGGSNVDYANGTERTDVNTKITTALQRKIVRHLKAERGKKVTSKIASTTNYGTEAIDAAYLAFCHSDVEADIRDMVGFVPCEKYGSMKALPYEIGKVEDVRYIASAALEPFLDAGSTTLSGMKSSGTQVDIYSVLYVAKDAYGHISLAGSKAFTPMVTRPDQASKSDPLGQKGTVGYKTYFDAVILNQAWMKRLEVGVTDL